MPYSEGRGRHDCPRPWGVGLVTETEGPMATWAFRAALSGLPDGDVRSILESDRCPQPDAHQDHTIATEEDGALLVSRPEEDGAWLRSDQYVSLASGDRR